jgi:hypothetical protein
MPPETLLIAPPQTWHLANPVSRCARMEPRVFAASEVLLRGNRLPDRCSRSLNLLPKIVGHDSKVWTVFNPPLLSRVVAHDAPTGSGFVLNRLLTQICFPRKRSFLRIRATGVFVQRSSLNYHDRHV